MKPCFSALLALVLSCGWSAPSTAEPPGEPQPIMTVDEVRVGMRGYGLTVFHGAAIEPFPVEVMSVVPDSSPKRSVIWVNCYDERMQRYGPVQGMSGSPIYLWDEGREDKLGVGGRLIGAFAFGYSSTNECMVGVQPIEYMRQTGERAELPEEAGGDDAEQEAGGSSARVGVTRPGTAVAMLRGLRDAASESTVPNAGTTARLAAEVVGRTPWGRGLESTSDAAGRKNATDDTGPRRLMLPIDVGSGEAASALRPMMAPTGLMPHAGGSWSGLSASDALATGVLGATPSNVAPDRVELEPGAVLSVPLAFGDYVPAASGTVTDVLPDGTVLGFGHAMDGSGDTALPMATGFTHFVVSRRNISFKRAGALALQGSVVQDEMAAVAGVAGVAYTTSPVKVAVSFPEQPRREYAYEVVNHPSYTPSIAVLMPIVSLVAVQTPPAQNTMRLSGTVSFTNGQTLELDQLLPFGSTATLAFELGPVMAALLANEFAPVELEGMDLDIDVTDDVELSFIQSVSVSPPVAAPGEEVTLTVVLQPYGGLAQTERLRVTLPTDLPEGEYPLVVSDSDSYLNRSLNSDPKWTTIDDADELFEVFGVILGTRRDALYATLIRNDAMMTGISVGNLELPNLPSHHAALLRSSATTLTGPGVPGLDRAFPTDHVTNGEAIVTVRVVAPGGNGAGNGL